MILLNQLVLVVIVGAIVFGVRRAAHRKSPSVSLPSPLPEREHVNVRGGRPVELSDTLDRWVTDGLLSPEQAAVILEHERSLIAAPVAARGARASGSPRRIPVFAEALGYLGGVLALVGLTLLVANYWPDLPTSVRLLLSLATTIVLVGAGALVHEDLDPALARLRWFLWMFSSATAAVFAGVLMIDGLEVDTTELVVAACAGTVAVTSGVLWWWRDRPVQELLAIAATMVAAGTFVSAISNNGFAGLTVWLLAAAALAAGLRGLTPEPLIPHAVGAVAMLVGAFVTVTHWEAAGWLFALVTAGGLLVLAALPRSTMNLTQRVVLVVVATIGALQGVPAAIGYFAQEAGGVTGLVMWAIGGALMSVGSRRLLRAPLAAEVIGGLGLIGGAALTGTQWPSFAPLFGLGTALTLLVIGMLPGRVLYSLVGSLGLLINVPWTIGRFFPGEGRAPLLILVSGVVIVGVAVLLARQGERFRRELTVRPHERAMPPPTATSESLPHRDESSVAT